MGDVSPREDQRIIASLLSRWERTHADFLSDATGRETVLAAYTDWVDATMRQRQVAFEAREGGKLLAQILRGGAR